MNKLCLIVIVSTLGAVNLEAEGKPLVIPKRSWLSRFFLGTAIPLSDHTIGQTNYKNLKFMMDRLGETNFETPEASSINKEKFLRIFIKEINREGKARIIANSEKQNKHDVMQINDRQTDCYIRKNAIAGERFTQDIKKTFTEPSKFATVGAPALVGCIGLASGAAPAILSHLKLAPSLLSYLGINSWNDAKSVTALVAGAAMGAYAGAKVSSYLTEKKIEFQAKHILQHFEQLHKKEN